MSSSSSWDGSCGPYLFSFLSLHLSIQQEIGENGEQLVASVNHSDYDTLPKWREIFSWHQSSASFSSPFTSQFFARLVKVFSPKKRISQHVKRTLALILSKMWHKIICLVSLPQNFDLVWPDGHHHHHSFFVQMFMNLLRKHFQVHIKCS